MIVKERALPTDYGRWIQTVKDRVRNAQLRTMVAINVEQLLLYWDIGHDILERQKNEGWGAKIIPRISADLIAEFPNAQGFSPRNLGYMKRFVASWPRKAILQAPLAKLPWFSQIALIEKLETREDRLGYARLAVENYWLRPQLVREIAARSIENFGKSANNFALTMLIADADKAIRAIRDSYDFTFLGLQSGGRECHGKGMKGGRYCGMEDERGE